MKGLLAGIAVLAWAGVASAQQVDIQVRIISDGTPVFVEVTSQRSGNTTAGDYWNANVPMPYVVPSDRWFCALDMTVEIRPNQSVPYARFCHDTPEGHDYHCMPVNRPRATPMAFPPGGATTLWLANPTGTRQWAQVTVSGYLGRDASATRDTACLP